MARRSIAGLRTIVTGASSGIGRALVIELISRDARVVALARREDRLRQLADQLAAPDCYRWIAGSITNQDDRAAALELARVEFGGLDALVNNAGIGAVGRFDHADEARLRQIMEVNFFAPTEFTREALRMLRQGQRPILVNVGSVLGHRAVPGKSEYCASKFALHGLTDSLRAELTGDGIDVLHVCPSTTASEFFDVAMGKGSWPEAKFGVMSTEAVARRIVAAMAWGRHEIILSLGGNALVGLDRFFPWLADWFVARWAQK